MQFPLQVTELRVAGKFSVSQVQDDFVVAALDVIDAVQGDGPACACGLEGEGTGLRGLFGLGLCSCA